MNASAESPKVWVDYWNDGSAPAPATVVQALAATGMQLCERSAKEHALAGILLFDKITQTLVEFLHEISLGGRERVLATALRTSALANGAAWELLRAGAADVFAWDHCAAPAVDVQQRLARWAEIERMRDLPEVRDLLVYQSPAMIQVLRQFVEVAAFTNASVLVVGESGTGKELAARLIHALDRRPDKRQLVVLDCTTVVPDLAGSEFFGHERGAYTGAVADRDGAFALADGGTLFLDEVGDLPLSLQAELLRVIQEHTYKRVGSNEWRKTNFRLVCATNRDLLGELAAGRFRSDLYFRIASWTCKLPSLRERSEDILPLATYFAQQARGEQEPVEWDQAVRDYLAQRPYPGNVRDLKHLVARMCCRHVGPGPITVGDVPEEERPLLAPASWEWHAGAFEKAIHQAVAGGVGLKEIRRQAEEIAVRIAVEKEGGNLQKAAGKLGVTDRALQQRRAARRRGES